MTSKTDIVKLEQELKTLKRNQEIEIALEHVRAASMAMHKSSDLHSVVTEVFVNLEQLGVEANSALLSERIDDDSNMHFWVAANGQVYPHMVHLPSIDSPFYTRFHKAVKESVGFFADIQSKKEKDEMFQHYFSNSTHKDVPLDRQKFILSADGIARSIVLFKNTALTIMRYNSNPYSSEENELIKRMGYVFQQSYRRYLDLQKAEAQARESEIELALERVRASSMAMLKSSDLNTVVKVLYDAFISLSLDFSTAVIQLNIDDTKDLNFVAETEIGDYNKIVNVPENTIPIFNEIDQAWKSADGYLVLHYDKAQKDAFLKEMFRVAKTSERREKSLFGTEGMELVGCFQKKVGICTTTSLDKEYLEIIRRFSLVFEQTYTRFLDLQKAEAQAREAQIETSLERVRARSMGMHESEQLIEVISLLNHELKDLGVNHASAVLMTDYDIDNRQDGCTLWSTTSDGPYSKIHMPSFEHVANDNYLKARRENKSYYSDYYSKKEKDSYFRFIFKHIDDSKITEARKKLVFDAKGWSRACVPMENSGLSINRYSDERFSNEDLKLIRRFGNVFEQAYTRFLDLKNAEKQAKEAQIEAALERVRAKSMAMHHTSELLDTAAEIFKQLEELGIRPWRSGLAILNTDQTKFEFWSETTTQKGRSVSINGSASTLGNVNVTGAMNAIKTKEDFYIYDLSGQDLIDYTRFITKDFNLPEASQDDTELPERMVYYCATFNRGVLYGAFLSTIENSDKQILKRFSKVFEQTYTRFLDLQKAENQAKEAQIETALERVRASSMAMHNSQDVGATVITLFDEVLKLGLDSSIRCGIGIIEETDHMETWSVSSFPNGEFDLKMGMLDMTVHPLLVKVKNSWKSGNSNYSEQTSGKELIRYYKALNNHPEYPFNADLDSVPEKEYHNSFSFREGIIFTFSPNPMSEEAAKVFDRFAHVFGQTYRRYLDLQKAETQAREATIEASLERVRSKAMSMHSSEDLTETVGLLFKELNALEIDLIRCGVGRVHEDRQVDLYTFSHSKNGEPVPVLGKAWLKGHPALNTSFMGWKDQKERHVVLKGESLKKYYELIKAEFKLPAQENFQVHYGYFFYFSAGTLYTYTSTKLTEEQLTIYRKFSSVVGLTYRRFLDLEEAEVQAREAQIEASLERVRAKAMAMHSSEDLTDTVFQLFKELNALDTNVLRCGVTRIYETKAAELYTYSRNKKGVPVPVLGKAVLSDHPILDNIFKGWSQQKEYHAILAGEDLKSYYIRLKVNFKLPEAYETVKHYGYWFYYPEGSLYTFTETQLTEDELKIYRRFNAVVGLTYRRYIDIQEAEKRARDASRQASLDRVRGEIASMRSTKDLQRITPLIWQELLALEIPFIRCGVFIMDEGTETLNAFLSSADGKLLAQLSLPFGFSNLTEGALEQWRQQKTYITHWNKDQFLEFMTSAMAKGQITSAENYQDATAPPESLHLHFLSFKQGMLYVGNTEALNQEHLNSIQILAKSFSLAYARLGMKILNN